MTPLYARVFTQILDSSLAEDWQARHVFEDLLKLADNGVVDMTRQAIVRRTNIPAEIIDRAIAKLEAPDPSSRDPGEDGRRIVRLDEHRDWGWLIVNWPKYEAIKRAEDQRLKTAERTRRWRDRKKVPPAPPPKADTDTASDTDTDTEAASLKRCTPSQGVTSGTKRTPARAAFAAPTHEEVKKYAVELGIPEEAEPFRDHYQSNGWRVGKTQMGDWKAALRQWKRRKPEFSRNADHPQPTDFKTGTLEI
jgi:hypothetical protein